MKKTNLYYVVIVILCVLPVILGALLIKDLLSGKSVPDKTASQNLVEPPVNTKNNAPAAQKNEVNAAQIIADAKQAEKLVFSNCTPVPHSLKVQKGGKIIVNNPDPVDHLLVIGPEEKFSIPKNSEKEITILFPKNFTVMGYGCDGAPQGVGFFVSP